MPRKLLARMDLEDRDPDGFKFPSKQNNNRARKSNKGKNKNATEHDENKMRGGIQFRDDGEVTKEDTTVFDAWMHLEYKHAIECGSIGVLADLRDHVFKLHEPFLDGDIDEEIYIWMDANLYRLRKLNRRKKVFSELAKEMGIKSDDCVREEDRTRNWKICGERDEEVITSKKIASCDEASSSSSSPFMEIPIHIRDIILKKTGVRASAAIASTCKELRDDVKEHRKHATGNFTIRSKDVRGEEDVRYILGEYPNVTGVSADKLDRYRGHVNDSDTEQLIKTTKMISQILDFTHLHEKVNRLGFTNSGLCFLDFVKIVCQSALPVQSLDFSGNTGTKSCFVNLPVPFRPSGYMSHMRSCEDEHHMDGLLGIRQLYKFYRTFCEETWGPHYLSSPSQFEDVRDHGQIIDLPRFKLIRELNVSNCGLKCHFDLFFYLRVFPCLRRLDAARNQELKICEPDDGTVISSHDRWNYHIYRSSDTNEHTGTNCLLEYLNVSGSATSIFRLKRAMRCNPFTRFDGLKELNLSASMRLETVHLEDLPNLEVLNLVNCKRLQHLRMLGLPSLRTLSLDICKNLTYLKYVNSPSLVDNDDDENIQKIESLRNLSMNQCDALNANTHLKLLQSAVNLEHYRCEGLHSLNMREVHVPSASLVSVEMSGSKQIQRILLNSAKLKLLKARNCRYLKYIEVDTKQQHGTHVETMVEIDVRNSAKLESVTGSRVDQSTRILTGGATSLHRIQTVD